MARAGAVYPQVEPGAIALMDPRLVECAPGARAAGAHARATRAGARWLILGGGAVARADEVSTAVRWGLGRAPVGALAWRDVPAVPARAGEIAVRRRLAEGAPMVRVRRGARVVGVIDGAAVAAARPALSVAHRLEHGRAAGADGTLWLLRLAGKAAEAEGISVHAVGGIVRDLLLGRSPLDVDLVVEGDGVAFARRLAPEIQGRVHAHASFGTASIAGGRGPDGAVLARVDVATARRERYAERGALPEVAPAALADDLARRDFSINAMALALAPERFGRLVDVPGAERDLAGRRLRPLHPLSFVEDPTRIFRAARYAARLGFRLDAMGRRALALALAAAPYPALSGQRLLAEVALIARDVAGWRAASHLSAWGALRLWHRGFRATPRARAHLAAARRFDAWARRAEIGLDEADGLLVALLLDQPPAVVRGSLARLAVTGARAERLTAAIRGARALAARVGRAARPRPSAIDAVLAGRDVAALAAAWLAGGAAARRRIEWFLAAGRGVRPLLGGDDLVRLGVPRGPEVGRCLAALRRARLDGAVSSAAGEQDFVSRWRAAGKGESR